MDTQICTLVTIQLKGHLNLGKYDEQTLSFSATRAPPLRVAEHLQIPARSRCSFDGVAGRRGEGKGARRLVYISCRSRLSFSHVEYGVMPFLSSSSTPASRVRRPPSCPPAGCPWWTVAVGVGSGKSSLNKLVWQQDGGGFPWLLCPRWLWE
jgi:hypothetical protein